MILLLLFLFVATCISIIAAYYAYTYYYESETDKPIFQTQKGGLQPMCISSSFNPYWIYRVSQEPRCDVIRRTSTRFVPEWAHDNAFLAYLNKPNDIAVTAFEVQRATSPDTPKGTIYGIAQQGNLDRWRIIKQGDKKSGEIQSGDWVTEMTFYLPTEWQEKKSAIPGVIPYCVGSTDLYFKRYRVTKNMENCCNLGWKHETTFWTKPYIDRTIY